MLGTAAATSEKVMHNDVLEHLVQQHEKLDIIFIARFHAFHNGKLQPAWWWCIFLIGKKVNE